MDLDNAIKILNNIKQLSNDDTKLVFLEDNPYSRTAFSVSNIEFDKEDNIVIVHFKYEGR